MTAKIPTFALINLLCLSITTVQADNTEKFPGTADYHNHMMAEFAFGGAWFHGKHQGEAKDALPNCGGNLIGSPSHAKTIFPLANQLIGQAPGTQGDTGLHLHRTGGYPDFDGWPRWDTIAHQQMWEGHLKQAWQQGLRTMVLSATSFRYLCEMMPKYARKYSCNEMDSAKLQIQAAINFSKSHDWFEIAYSADDVKKIVKRGHLAVILGLEISELFENQNWRQSLQEYYQMGVRSIQIGHEIDNQFTGVAPHNFIFKLFEFIKNVSNGKWHGFKLDQDGKNILGLTDEGKALAKQIIDYGMLIDAAHLSERSVKDLLSIYQTYSNTYPLFISHGHVRSMLLDEKAKEEKTIPDWMLEAVRDTGGVFGLRTGPDATKTFQARPEIGLYAVDNNCAGSTKSFSQSYLYAQSLQVNTGYATDFNGFIQQIRPRFGNANESCGAIQKDRKTQQAEQNIALGNAFDQKGLAHIGLLHHVTQELINFGVNTDNLDYSAYHFYKMWQKAENIASQSDDDKAA